jgi:hypothetical protein
MRCSIYDAVDISDITKSMIGWSLSDVTEGMWKELVLEVTRFISLHSSAEAYKSRRNVRHDNLWFGRYSKQ